MIDIPETIFVRPRAGRAQPVDGWVEYRRALLPPTLSAAMELPEVRALCRSAAWAKSALAGLPMDEATTAQTDGLTAALAPFTEAKK